MLLYLLGVNDAFAARTIAAPDIHPVISMNYDIPVALIGHSSGILF
jgi:hypothetical protein